MRSLKNHFGVILPLFVLLFAIEFSIVASKILSDYESSMSDEYNIIAVSQKELSDEVFKSRIPSFKNAILLDAKPVLDRLKGQMSDKNLKELENSLPKFYSIKLNILPSPTFMAKIERDLLGIEGISKVETFAKTHDKIYKMLVLFKTVAQGVTALMALMGITLIFKQMRIWLYEHRRRIEVMSDLGASFWLKASRLYKLAIADSIVATALVCAIYIFAPSLLSSVLFSVGFSMPSIDIVNDAVILLAASVSISIITVSVVMLCSKASYDF